MSNVITLFTISEILDKNFFIPSYQRGYRWNNQQVKDLLNDIYSFAVKKNKTEQEFYCLQPIVLKECNDEIKLKNSLFSDLDNNKWYEIIDGQQRLTTLRILMTYLIKEHLNGKSLYSEYGMNEFLIEYETREGTKEFLNKIADSNDNIDFYFISQAYLCISEWFEEHKSQRDIRESILRTLTCNMENQKEEGVVQVIWYEINNGINAIDTFIRINMGKIPLTNAELIKALFLQKRNFGNKETAELKQIEIASEWDQIEYTLQNNDFWWFLNKAHNDIPARIEFLFDLMFKVEKEAKKNEGKEEEFQKTYGTDKHVIFRFFNQKFSKEITLEEVENEWSNVKDYFLTFEEWYTNPIWYHYIGFLIYCGNSIVEIHSWYKDKAKNTFTETLKREIKLKFQNIECKKINIEEEKIQYKINLPFTTKNKPKIRELLLLLNLEFIIKQYAKTKEQSDDEIFMKFPFKIFKKDNWDIEHIDSYTTNPIIDKKTQIEWLETALKDLNEKITAEIKAEIHLFINGDNQDKSFEDFKDIIIATAEEKSNDEEAKNSIGNLTLLDAGTNRAYGNALFPSKRRMIIQRDMDGKFIPICTKNIFLKYFDKKGYSRAQWTEEDMNHYQNFIVDILYNFLHIKESDDE